MTRGARLHGTSMYMPVVAVTSGRGLACHVRGEDPSAAVDAVP
jgi:hypothetical protein